MGRGQRGRHGVYGGRGLGLEQLGSQEKMIEERLAKGQRWRTHYAITTNCLFFPPLLSGAIYRAFRAFHWNCQHTRGYTFISCLYQILTRKSDLGFITFQTYVIFMESDEVAIWNDKVYRNPGGHYSPNTLEMKSKCLHWTLLVLSGQFEHPSSGSSSSFP